MDAPRRIPIHSSLNRRHLMLGGERTLVMMTGLIVVTLAFSASFKPTALFVGAIFWVAAHAALVKLAKVDPEMSIVYQRHLQYRAWYAARGCVHAVLLPEKKSKL
jgi:type IV secretory pathway TrbD component